jgi:hypothetical protein
MTTIQLKTKIQNTLDEIPEDVLPDILDYLNMVRNQSHDQAKLNNNIKKILYEDKELFMRLAK